MHIETDDASFVLQNFVIHKFYGKDTCFAWKENQLVAFPLSEDSFSNSTINLSISIAPGVIKNLQNFTERVFVICRPYGIYKLTRALKFALLSKSGIGIGSLYSEVISFQEDYIALENKHEKNLKKLFQVFSESVTSEQLCSFKLTVAETDQDFRRAFLEQDDNKEDSNVCLIAYNKTLYKQTERFVKIIYGCDHSIDDILPIEKNGKIFGLTLITIESSAVVFIYLQGNKLHFDKTYLNYDERRIETFCVKMDENIRDCLLIVYSQDSKMYQCRKMLELNSVQIFDIQERHFIALRFYKSNFIIGLTTFNDLQLIKLKQITNAPIQGVPDYVDLKLGMLKGTEVLVERICEKAKELQKLNEKLEVERDTLQRLNLFARNHREQYCPDYEIKKLANRKYLSSRFKNILPLNSDVILSVKCGAKRTFCVRKVTSGEMLIDLPLPDQGESSEPIEINVDLIVHRAQGKPICLIKDFIQDPKAINEKRRKLSLEKNNFLNVKMQAIKDLLVNEKLSVEALLEIRNSVRKEMQELS